MSSSVEMMTNVCKKKRRNTKKTDPAVKHRRLETLWGSDTTMTWLYCEPEVKNYVLKQNGLRNLERFTENQIQLLFVFYENKIFDLTKTKLIH